MQVGPQLRFVLLVFAASFLLGFISFAVNPASAEYFGIPNNSSEFFTPSLFAWIFFHNVLLVFLAMLSGIFFGIPTVLFLISNGFLLGSVAFLIHQKAGWLFFLVGILPHGMIELPATFLAVALGLRLGGIFYRELTQKKSFGLWREIGLSLRYFVIIIIPMLFLAALIETFVTPHLLGI